MFINLRDIDKRSLVKRIIEHEQNGFECVAPIAQINTAKKQFKYRGSSMVKHVYSGMDVNTMYTVRMRRVDDVTG